MFIAETSLGKTSSRRTGMGMLRAGRLSFLRFTIVVVMLAFFLGILVGSA